MNVRCDECGHRFIPKPYEEPTPEGGLSMKFRCPECGHVYPVATLTPRGVQLREQMAEALARRDIARANRLRQEFQRQVRIDARGEGV
mgnify:CR=1 FL=1